MPAAATEAHQHAYHAGHSAAHVTRLHRWDHSGYASMLEAEAQWSNRVATSVAAEVSERGMFRRHRRLRSGVAQSDSESARTSAAQPVHHRRWLRISPAQAEGLMEHQEAHRRSVQAEHSSSQVRKEAAAISSGMERKASSLLNQTSDFLRADAGAKVEYTVEEDHSKKHGTLLKNIRRHLRWHSSPQNSGAAVTALTSLSSQYVGPIGVGTVIWPTTCNVQNGTTLEFLDWKSEALRKAKCHLENESQIWVVFDTGSTNIWVASDLCIAGACVKNGRHRYNHTRSSTYDWPIGGLELSVQFGTGCIKGPQALDDFHIGPFTVFNQTFGMIESQSGAIDEMPIEGILGLAFSSMSANGVTPFFDNIISQKALVHNEFAFYFSLDSVTANAVFWGGVDPSFFEGEIEFYPVIDPYYWALELVSFKVGTHEFKPEGSGSYIESVADQASEGRPRQAKADEDNDWHSFYEHSRRHAAGSWKAIVDTGTTFFTAEGDMYDEIVKMLPPIRCSGMTKESHPPITYRLRSVRGENDFVLHNHQYMTSGSSGSDAHCTAAFMRIDIPPRHGPAMVLGETFLRHYYSVFDCQDGHPKNARAGFAKSKHENTALDQLAHLTRGQQAFKLHTNESGNLHFKSHI